MALSKNHHTAITVMEVVLIQVSFLTVGSRHKNKNVLTEYHDIFISFKSRVYSKHGSPIFPLFGVMGFSIISPHFGKGQDFSGNSSLTNLVDVQRLHENCK